MSQEYPAQRAIQRLEENEERFNTYANEEGYYTTNTTPAVQVKTLRTFMDGLEGSANSAVEKAQAGASAAQAAAGQAAEEVVRASHVADSLPGFQKNAFAIFAFKVDDQFRLNVYKSEPDETVYADDYDSITVLPASCQFSMQGNRLRLYIPFTA